MFLRAGDGLIEPQIDFVCGVDAALFADGGHVLRGPVPAFDGFGVGREFGHGRTKGTEVVDHGLIHQYVAVGQEQNPLLAARLPQPPDDLKGGVGFAGSRGHDEQDAVAAFGNGLYRGVDGADLVIAGNFVAAVFVIILENDGFGFGCQLFPRPVACPQVVR